MKIIKKLIIAAVAVPVAVFLLAQAAEWLIWLLWIAPLAAVLACVNRMHRKTFRILFPSSMIATGAWAALLIYVIGPALPAAAHRLLGVPFVPDNRPNPLLPGATVEQTQPDFLLLGGIAFLTVAGIGYFIHEFAVHLTADIPNRRLRSAAYGVPIAAYVAVTGITLWTIHFYMTCVAWSAVGGMYSLMSVFDSDPALSRALTRVHEDGGAQ